MGCCLSKEENLFDKVVVESIFLDFLIRNIEVDNDWEGSADSLEDTFRFVSVDQLNKLEYDECAFLMASTDISVTVSPKKDPSQKGLVSIKKGNAWMFAPYHGYSGNISLIFSSDNNKAKSVIIADRKLLQATLAGINKAPTPSQLQVCFGTPLGDILNQHRIFADLSVEQYDFLQPFIRWRYIECNSTVFSVEAYEDMDDILGMHILVDGACVVLDEADEKELNSPGKRPAGRGGDPADTSISQSHTIGGDSAREILSSPASASPKGSGSPVALEEGGEGEGDHDLHAMITDILSMKTPEVPASHNGPSNMQQPKRQSEIGKKKHKSHGHRSPLHPVTHALSVCFPCLGSKSNTVYAADGTVMYHGRQVGVKEADSSNSMYATSMYSGESEFVAFGATAGLSPSNDAGGGLFNGFSQKGGAPNKVNRRSSKKATVGSGANYAASHRKAVSELDQVSYQGQIPEVGKIYNKGAVVGAELSLIENNVVQMSRVETLERSVFAVLTPTAVDLIEKSGSVGASIVQSLRSNWKVKLLNKLKKTVPFLCDINRSEMSALARKVTIHTYTSPDVIFTQGDQGDNFYIIIHGNVGIYQVPKARIKALQDAQANRKSQGSIPAAQQSGSSTSTGWTNQQASGLKDAHGRSQSISCLKTLTRGHYFGEVSLVAGKERIATAVATPGTILLGMSKKMFLHLFMERRTILTELRLKLHPADQPIPLILVLQHSRGYNMLLRFLKKELAQENILFWREVDRLEEFIRSKIRWVKGNCPKDGADAVLDFDAVNSSSFTVKIVDLHRPLLIIAQRVAQIVDKYVHTNSPLQVNIPDGMCREIQANATKYFREGMEARLPASGDPAAGNQPANWKPVNFGSSPGIITSDAPPPVKLSPTERNTVNITKILLARGISDQSPDSPSDKKKKHECMDEIKEDSLEEQERKSMHVELNDDEPVSSEEVSGHEVIDMLEMLLQLFNSAKGEVLLMLAHDGYKRWKETKSHAEFRSLITPYSGVPEGHVNQIAENTKEMFVHVDMDNK